MSSKAQPAPIALSIQTRPKPQTPAELYLDLMKKIVTRALVAKPMERHTILPEGPKSSLLHQFNRWAARLGMEAVRLMPSAAENYLESGHEAANRVEDAETMLGIRQLDNMQECVTNVIRHQVPGDLLEAGVWRGGMTIFMRAILKAHQITDRQVWVADSFEGLPEINREHETFSWQKGAMAASLDAVQNNFAKYGLLDEQVIFLRGFFSETLPTAPIGQLAILRVDADLYQSTADVLRHLYAKLSPGGYAIFDDYQNLSDCRRAIEDFRRDHRIGEELLPIDDRAVYWQKHA